MPLAVTHVLLTIVVVSIYRDYFTKHKKLFPLFTVLIAGIGGLLPDLDIPLSWLLYKFGIVIPLFSHGGITHTPFFAMLFLIPAIILWLKKRKKLAILFGVISFGVLFHVFLDFMLGGGSKYGLMLLFPFSMIRFSIIIDSSLPTWFYTGLDAAILLGWLLHEELKHKIKDFI